MYKKLIYSIVFVMLLASAGNVQAALEAFSISPSDDGHVGNDEQLGPDDNEGTASAMYIRDIDVRRRVSFVSYNISELQSEQNEFSDVYFSIYGANSGTIIVYGVIEELDDIDETTITWNTAPGVKNDPAPAVGEPVELDYADLTAELLRFTSPGSNARESTEASQALDDFLNADTDGIVTFIFAPPESQNNCIIRAKDWTGGEGTPYLGGMFTPPPTAIVVDPTNGQENVPRDTVLTWRAGYYADEQDVYFGTDVNDVNQADRDNPMDVLVSEGREESSYDPPGVMDFGQTYYWRIDGYSDTHTDSPWRGNVWSFTVSDYAVVEDFEDYNDYQPNTIFDYWSDGYYDETNGSTAGYGDPNFTEGEHYLETRFVNSGAQSMPLCYDNSTVAYSEISVINTANLKSGNDWAVGSPGVLVLWLSGEPRNTAGRDQLYIKINNEKILYDGDLVKPQWRQWAIDLSSLNTNLSNVTQFCIGLDAIGGAGSRGCIYFDDIRLYKEAPVVSTEEIWIEAEDADTRTAPFQIYDDVTTSGGQYISTEEVPEGSDENPPYPDGTVTYNFEIVEGGTYIVSLRDRSIDTGDSVWVRIPGATTQTSNHESGWVWFDVFGTTDYWTWEGISSSTDSQDPTVLWTMEPGSYTLEIACRESGAGIDAITIIKQMDEE